MKKIVLVIIFIVLGSYSVQAQLPNTETRIWNTEAEKVLVNGEYISKSLTRNNTSFSAVIIYKKKFYQCYSDKGHEALTLLCFTVPK